MIADDFNRVLQDQIDKTRGVLVQKAGEYADDRDRLRNFKQAAHLRGVTTRDALAGMMAKHTVSVYDLCEADACAELVVWDEKITDHINYLVLLRALVIEELMEKDIS